MKSATKIYDNAMHMMEECGGSFVKALVNCWYMADRPNKQKLRAEFAEYFDKYEHHFEEWKKARTGESQ